MLKMPTKGWHLKSQNVNSSRDPYESEDKGWTFVSWTADEGRGMELQPKPGKAKKGYKRGGNSIFFHKFQFVAGCGCAPRARKKIFNTRGNHMKMLFCRFPVQIKLIWETTYEKKKESTCWNQTSVWDWFSNAKNKIRVSIFFERKKIMKTKIKRSFISFS